MKVRGQVTPCVTFQAEPFIIVELERNADQIRDRVGKLFCDLLRGRLLCRGPAGRQSEKRDQASK